ncbi:sugar transporter SWEET1 [Papilio machaon]|uniref:sugar transporter SWEET1 n=1 Tax=Papilio machaon TaxID=76193 RepID=UPI0006EADB7A|nr:sugar transporter SWEET1 [Papilio machaon]
MEMLSDVLQPYKELVGSVAAIVTIGQMFSGSFICYDVYKQGNTRGITIAPFLGGVVMSLLNLKYGYILRDDKMIQVNLVGLALNIVYVLVYFHYTSEKVKVWAKIGLAGAFTVALLGYAEMEDPKLVENRFGTIITAFMFYLIASPLFGLREIIKNQSTEGLPFPIIFSGAIVTFMWLLYGIILKNKFLIIQNVVAVILCSIQLSLFVIYPSKRATKEKVKAKAKKAD